MSKTEGQRETTIKLAQHSSLLLFFFHPLFFPSFFRVISVRCVFSTSFYKSFLSLFLFFFFFSLFFFFLNIGVIFILVYIYRSSDLKIFFFFSLTIEASNYTQRRIDSGDTVVGRNKKNNKKENARKDIIFFF